MSIAVCPVMSYRDWSATCPSLEGKSSIDRKLSERGTLENLVSPREVVIVSLAVATIAMVSTVAWWLNKVKSTKSPILGNRRFSINFKGEKNNFYNPQGGLGSSFSSRLDTILIGGGSRSQDLLKKNLPQEWIIEGDNSKKGAPLKLTQSELSQLDQEIGQFFEKTQKYMQVAEPIQPVQVRKGSDYFQWRKKFNNDEEEKAEAKKMVEATKKKVEEIRHERGEVFLMLSQIEEFKKHPLYSPLLYWRLQSMQAWLKERQCELTTHYQDLLGQVIMVERPE